MTINYQMETNGNVTYRNSTGIVIGVAEIDNEARIYRLVMVENPIGWPMPQEFNSLGAAEYWLLALETELLATGH